ncbi:MAG TPA: type II toxin-antitoxin system RelE/ParE family toxin [Humisphaera sp.]|nr:type II toxin-antitoxin system RelE/ParE family toxin [Humisphaera sp.]
MIEITHYLTRTGRDVFEDWMDDLNDPRAEAKIEARLARLAGENFGDCKPLRAGVWELRIDAGPGYRVYYAMAGRSIVLLLCGGDKRKQASDIERAVEFWKDYKERTSKP